MEDDESISVHVPSFARGLNLLLIDDTASSLLYLSLLLEQYTFKVTAIEEVSMAKSIICNHEGYFRLVMVKLNMLGKDVFSFLDFFHEKDIPVVFISSGGLEDVIWKALAKGLCYFFEEPILFEDLKYLWKHAYHSKHRSTKEAQYANKAAGENEETKIDNDDQAKREKSVEL
ncbi:hypothetical protein Fmac_001645 [Flemingia macrophylla]|uniref:Response regulatory domain-containing protein n=1 Tax=Flemingia macrophylla TaxID=520843 RepID=A0ABD1NKJ6_9FABA